MCLIFSYLFFACFSVLGLGVAIKTGMQGSIGGVVFGVCCCAMGVFMQCLIARLILNAMKSKPMPKKGDLVRIIQPTGAYHNYIGFVIDNPDRDGFTLFDGDSTLVCPAGDVLRVIRRHRARFGMPEIPHDYEILSPLLNHDFNELEKMYGNRI